MGRRDREACADLVFDILRRRRLYHHISAGWPGDETERLVAASRLMRAGVPPADPQWRERFERIAPRDTLAPAVRYALPDWLYERLHARYRDDGLDALLDSLLQGAAVDLRVNTLKTDVAGLISALAAQRIDARALRWPPNAVRLHAHVGLERLDQYRHGWFEVQDAGSQLLVDVLAPRRGQTIVDFCAGAGGKSLALAAAMRNTGQIYALDVNPKRLARLRPRLARSGASNVQPLGIDSEHDPRLARLAEKADAVLIDAPCSGTGTLRRNPDLKWRLDSADIMELARLQRSILAAAAKLVRPGGYLVYATCSLLTEENDAIVDDFLAEHSARWAEQSVGDQLAKLAPELATMNRLRLRPDRHDCDGFFAVLIKRIG